MIATRTERQTFLTIPGTDIEVQTDGSLPPYHADVYVTTNDDGSYRLAWLLNDDDGYGLWEWSDGSGDPEQWSNGAFKDFRNHYDRYDGMDGQDGRDAFFAAMVEKVGEANVFLVEVYSHGLESFSRVDAGRFYPDRQWDVCASCVLAVPPDVTNPAEWADGVLESYTSVVNGDVYGIVSLDVPADYDGSPLETDSVWGFIGSEYAEEAAKSGDF